MPQWVTRITKEKNVLGKLKKRILFDIKNGQRKMNTGKCEMQWMA